MENNNLNESGEWVNEQLACLDPPETFLPDSAHALARFQKRCGAKVPRRSGWHWPAWAVTILVAIAIVLYLPLGRVVAQQLWQLITVRRVAVIRVQPWPAGVPSPRVKLIGTVIPPIPARDAADAGSRVHYQVRLPSAGVLAGNPRLSTTFSMAAGTVVHVADLQLALTRSGIAGQSVPAQWDGAQLTLNTSPIVLAEWPGIAFAQSLPLTLTAPPGFEFSVFSALVLRILGVQPEDALRLARQMGTTPLWLAPIDRNLIRSGTLEQVELNTGPGTLVQERDGGGALKRLTVFWTASDRVYLLSGVLSRELAILAANSVQ